MQQSFIIFYRRLNSGSSHSFYGRTADPVLRYFYIRGHLRHLSPHHDMVRQHTHARSRAHTPHHLLQPVVRCPATLGLQGRDSEPESSFTRCWHERQRPRGWTCTSSSLHSHRAHCPGVPHTHTHTPGAFNRRVVIFYSRRGSCVTACRISRAAVRLPESQVQL